MTPSRPPDLATWVLEHLMLGGKNEPLAGDLIEEFQRRQSVVWYWRQVGAAICVNCSNKIRKDWRVVWAFVFISVWLCGFYVFSFKFLPDFLGENIRLANLVSGHAYYGKIIGFALLVLLPLVLPLIVYLAGARNLRLQKFTIALCVGLLVITAPQALLFVVLVASAFAASLRNIKFRRVSGALFIGSLALLLLQSLTTGLHGARISQFLSACDMQTYWTVLSRWNTVLQSSLPLLAAMWVAHLKWQGGPANRSRVSERSDGALR